MNNITNENFKLQEDMKKIEIKRLKKEKRYDDIFEKYGEKDYKKNSPYFRYRRKDLKKLLKEKRYEEIYRKYGKKKFNKLLDKAKYNDIKFEKGKISAVIWMVKNKVRKAIKKMSLSAGLLITTGSIVMSEAVENNIYENAKTYKSEINTYNKNIDDYSKEIKTMGLSDLQIFMKLMDDMWNSIKGYKSPEKDIMGFAELDLMDENGYGVCRNMASDIAKKLNNINPEYNARTINVEMSNYGEYVIADINRNILDEDESNNENENNLTNVVKKIIGNHMVTLVDVKQDNVTLVLDPTNPGIGIYSNGNIKMFNSMKENGRKFSSKEISSAIFSGKGVDGFEKQLNDYMSSFGIVNIKELEAKYGIDAQNKALNEVRSKQIANNIIKDMYNHDDETQLPEHVLKRIDEIILQQENVDYNSDEKNNHGIDER